MKRERLRTNLSRICPKNGDLGNMKTEVKGCFSEDQPVTFEGAAKPWAGTQMVSARSASCSPTAQNAWDCAYRNAKHTNTKHPCALTLPTHTQQEVAIPPEMQPHAGKSHQGTIGGEQDRESETRAGKIHAGQEEQPPGTAQCSEVGRDASPAIGTSSIL